MEGKSPMSIEEIMDKIDKDAPKLTSQEVLGVDGLCEKDANRLVMVYSGNYDVRKCTTTNMQTGISRYSVHITGGKI